MTQQVAGTKRMWIPALAVVLVLCGCTKGPTPQEQLKFAQSALRESNDGHAAEHARKIPESAGEWNAARLILGEVAARQGDYAGAADYYLSIRQDGSEDAVRGLFSLAEIDRERGRLSEAIRLCQRVLDQQPGNLAARERLAFLLSVTGRHWESAKHFESIVRSGAARLDELVLFADPGRPVEQRGYLAECLRKAPCDSAVLLGLAAAAFREGRRANAIEQLTEILEAEPDSVAALAMQGEFLLDEPAKSLINWHHRLPKAAEKNPEIWYVRGRLAKRWQDLPRAAWCYRRCLELAPAHRRATYQLSQVLAALKHPLAERIAELSELQIQLSQTLDDVLRSEGDSEPAIHRVVELLIAAGRVWEACAWALWADEQFPNLPWPQETLLRYQDRLTDNLAQFEGDHNPAQLLKADRFTEFDGFAERLADIELRSDAGATPASSIQFGEVAEFAGFEYFNGEDPATRGARLFEQTGGGVAVIDLDLDLRPDVYLTQGLRWPTGQLVPDHSDQRSDALFRNGPGGLDRDVFGVACLSDTGFGQGCTVGDFDNDGFPDLYVANIGRNALLMNQGDGTFRDVSVAAGLSATDWTSSVLLADLNADGNPDLYEVGYLAGSGVFERICGGRACSPSGFDGCRDRLLISDGVGSFHELHEATPAAESKGLGIVTVPADDLSRLHLMIANDQVANHFLINTAEGDRNVILSEQGLPSGLAFNEDGLSMGCMGIAADDINGDGRLDLFVTNFQNEFNTVYVQEAGGFFVDSTRSSGLAMPSLSGVGWGTQFLDADLDGFSDLVVANGHVDDYRDEGGMYYMRPQLFRGLGHARFVEVSPSSDLDFFDTPILGRGLARLDWNCDGRMDFAVSCVLDSARLVTNTTAETGHFINIRMHATQSARDAVGARVTVSANGLRRTKHLLAGDGYMASNQRIVQFGLGTIPSVDSVVIDWPSGSTTSVVKIPGDTTLSVVEGRSSGTLEGNQMLQSIRVQSGSSP